MINISSVLGKSVCPDHGLLHYQSWHQSASPMPSLSKWSIVAFVNALCPGWVDTAMAILGIKQTVALQGITPEQFKAKALAAVPIKRFLDPGEVANLVCYVASEQAKGVTNQAINICSGQTMI
jgi:NAD(P)-dependent dehydrogenase (short-subunit alcohol dehydrogenase family)